MYEPKVIEPGTAAMVGPLTQPVFFMHIAKTAGSFVNEAFRSTFGDAAVLTHAENRLGNSQDLQNAQRSGAVFVSGHIMDSHWQALTPLATAGFYKFSVVREPTSHLISHLLWLDHYNLPDKRTEFQMLDRRHQHLVELIGETDLSNPAMLDDLLTHLPPLGIRLLDNCQSRYFLPSALRGMLDHTPLTLQVCRALRDTISTFDAVIRQDCLGEGLAKVGSDLNVKLDLPKSPVNTAKSARTIDAENPILRQVLSKRTLVDQWLWRFIVGEGRALHG